MATASATQGSAPASGELSGGEVRDRHTLRRTIFRGKSRTLSAFEKENAVEDFRKLIGATDPKKAAPGTIRALFAKSIDANAIHGSDSDANAEIESNFFFSQFERTH